MIKLYRTVYQNKQIKRGHVNIDETQITSVTELTVFYQSQYAVLTMCCGYVTWRYWEKEKLGEEYIGTL